MYRARDDCNSKKIYIEISVSTLRILLIHSINYRKDLITDKICRVYYSVVQFQIYNLVDIYLITSSFQSFYLCLLCIFKMKQKTMNFMSVDFIRYISANDEWQLHATAIIYHGLLMGAVGLENHVVINSRTP